MYCSRCKTTEGKMIKNSKMGGKYYYHCRECNRKRAAKYRETEIGKENIRKAVYKSILKYPEKQRAREILNYHVKSGKILKPPYCQICKKKCKLEAHHSNYTKPLDVMWICRPCHCII